jgi:hypothetical protein
VSENRPEYGEFASPEEQAAAAGVQPHWDPPTLPASRSEPGAAAATTVAAPRRWDLTLTMVLIVLGTFATFNSFGGYADLAGTLNGLYKVYGYTGTVADPVLANRVGVAMNVVQVVALVLAVIVSARRLRAGRLAFPVPLIAALVAAVASVILVGSVLGSDPAFLEFLNSQPTMPTSTPRT